MDRVGVAVGAIFFQLHAARGVTTVFLGGIARNAVRSLVGIGTALGAFESDRNAYALLSHGSRFL